MKAFEVYVNGERVCTAGVADGVMTVIVNHVGRKGFGMHIGGLEADHVDWDAPAIGVGDEITIRMVETESVDPPARHAPREDDEPKTVP